MPYALFTNDEQISKAYQTRHEVWKKAEEAGLVVELASEEEERQPERVLDEGYDIRPCPPDSTAPNSGKLRKTSDADMSDHKVSDDNSPTSKTSDLKTSGPKTSGLATPDTSSESGTAGHKP